MLALLGLTASVLVGIATPYGLGLRDDSFTYLTTAETLSESLRFGRYTAAGEFKPVTNVPPLYPAMLGGLHSLFGDLNLTARRMNQVLFGSIVILTGVASYVATRSPGAAALAACLALTSDVLLGISTWALSEALFLGLLLFAILAIHWLGRQPHGRLVFGLASLSLALLSLARYVGVSFLIAGAAFLTFHRGLSGKALRRGCILLLLGAIPTAAFAWRNLVLTGNPANRPLPYWHPPGAAAWEMAGRTLLRWFVPERALEAMGPLALALSLAALFLIGVCLTLHLLRRGGDSTSSLDDGLSQFGLLLVFGIVSYAMTILATAFFLDALTPLNDRILSPLHSMVLLLMTMIGYGYFRHAGHAVRWGILLAAAGFLLFQSYRQYFALRGLMQDGQGYAAQAWRESQVLDYLCETPAIPIYTNDLPALYFHCHRLAYGLPSPILAATGRPNPAYARQLAEFHQTIRREGGLVAFVGWYGEARLERTGFLELVAGLRLTDTFDDGLIYSP